MEIKIDEEFKSLIPPISEEALGELEKSILEEGCRDRLVLWDDILLDGHQRYEICQGHDIKFGTNSKTFENRNEAKSWVIRNQLARRNLTVEQLTYLRGQLLNLAEKRQGARNDLTSDQNEPKLSKIAKECGVSPATLKRDAKFAGVVEKLPEEERREILSGRSGKSKSQIIRQAKYTGQVEEQQGSSEDRGTEGVLSRLKFYWGKASAVEREEFLRWINM